MICEDFGARMEVKVVRSFSSSSLGGSASLEGEEREKELMNKTSLGSLSVYG